MRWHPVLSFCVKAPCIHTIVKMSSLYQYASNSVNTAPGFVQPSLPSYLYSIQHMHKRHLTVSKNCILSKIRKFHHKKNQKKHRYRAAGVLKRNKGTNYGIQPKDHGLYVEEKSSFRYHLIHWLSTKFEWSLTNLFSKIVVVVVVLNDLWGASNNSKCRMGIWWKRAVTSMPTV